MLNPLPDMTKVVNRVAPWLLRCALRQGEALANPVISDNPCRSTVCVTNGGGTHAANREQVAEMEDTGPVIDVSGGFYRIVVREQIAPHWQSHLAGLQIRTSAAGGTILEGLVPDQAACYGLLGRLRDLGLTLLEVQRVTAPHALGPGPPAAVESPTIASGSPTAEQSALPRSDHADARDEAPHPAVSGAGEP